MSMSCTVCCCFEPDAFVLFIALTTLPVLRTVLHSFITFINSKIIALDRRHLSWKDYVCTNNFFDANEIERARCFPIIDVRNVLSSALFYFVHIVFRIFKIIHIHSSLCNTPVRFSLKTSYLCHSFSIYIPYNTKGEVQHTQCSMVIFGQDEGKELHNHRLSHHDLRSGFIFVSVARSAVVFFQILSPVVRLFCSQFLSFYGHW